MYSFFFLSDSTTRLSDRASNGPAPSGAIWEDLGRNENRPRPLPLTPMLNPFFSQNRALNTFSIIDIYTFICLCSLWLPGGLAPPCRVISNGRKSLYERHTASTEAYSVKMAAVQCNNSIRSLTETPFYSAY